MYRRQSRSAGGAAVPPNKSLGQPYRAQTKFSAKQNRTGLQGYKMTQKLCTSQQTYQCLL